MWHAKEVLSKGYRWVVGDGRKIIACKDPWLANKVTFKVEENQCYMGREEAVNSLFYPGSKRWDADKVYSTFTSEDAKAILATFVPQRSVKDRIVWSMSNDEIYSVKTGYHFWHNHNVSESLCTVYGGWNKLWRLSLPHKMKIFL